MRAFAVAESVVFGRHRRVQNQRQHPIIVAPSILGGDHANLAASARQIIDAGLTWFHLDIMDGHFVPNLTFGPGTVAALRPLFPQAFFDVHLMLARPDLYVDAFAKAGANLISIHTEPDYDIAATLRTIAGLGCQRGITVNPGTPIGDVLPYLNDVELVLVMSVQPGFGGQSFREEVLPKISQLAAWRAEGGFGFRIEVDGGVNEETGSRCIAAGADTLVAGSAFFKAADKKAFARTLGQG